MQMVPKIKIAASSNDMPIPVQRMDDIIGAIFYFGAIYIYIFQSIWSN